MISIRHVRPDTAAIRRSVVRSSASSASARATYSSQSEFAQPLHAVDLDTRLHLEVVGIDNLNSAIIKVTDVSRG
jgi:hypothetical protein